ncbi:hypothetical protein CHLRE_10g440650v5 [Chlamydomonas reinhardtii]|uniref:Methyltransferase domain-containing protein n=1 Tax=Chlamydomonas reinhardtii TaxID=3055 RepID=A0A2K3DAH6_CHLRE|nr:uncharacterized protein CHLRE_10g440650v5 [Chlamydomonas reinhardtii]PNW77529.1 hypothetical protein CHLRE_10g440650v5 [Chlamydomonas reinhardtii]
MADNNRERIWDFEKAAYWDARYKQRIHDSKNDHGEEEKTFDWLCTYEACAPIIATHIGSARLGLDIGCGNALFADAVCRAHPQLQLLGVDYSTTLFELVGSTLGPSGRTDWMVMDARRLAFRRCFDVVLDKGCLDALLAGWDQLQVLRGWGRQLTDKEERLGEAALASARALLAEVAGCLVEGGRYICISYEAPSGRQQLFDSVTSAAACGAAGGVPLPLRLVESAVEQENHNYVYVFERGDPQRQQQEDEGKGHREQGQGDVEDEAERAR